MNNYNFKHTLKKDKDNSNDKYANKKNYPELG